MTSRKYETLVPRIEMDLGVLYTQYAMLVNKQLAKASEYDESCLPPKLLSAISSSIKTLMEIDKDRRAAEREREELTDREKMAYIQAFLDESPQLQHEVKELVANEVSKQL